MVESSEKAAAKITVGNMEPSEEETKGGAGDTVIGRRASINMATAKKPVKKDDRLASFLDSLNLPAINQDVSEPTIEPENMTNGLSHAESIRLIT